MRAIWYLWRRSIRNGILQVLKKPVQLILYLLLAVFLIWSLTISYTQSSTAAVRNVHGYAAALVGVFLFIAGLSIYNGLKQGTALFSMPDVGLLFTSPVNPRTILLSGIARQAGIMLFASVFLLFQYPNIRRLAGLDGMALLGLMVAYVILGITLHILSACLYAYSAGSPARRKRVNNVFSASFAALLILFVLFFIRNGNSIRESLASFFGSDAWDYVPVIGWSRGLAIAITEYRLWGALLFAALMCISAICFTMLLQRTDMDFFEDVLVAAERASQIKEDAKAGRLSSAAGETVRKVNREQGPLWGNGALAFTGKLFREQSRSGVLLFDITTLSAAACPLLSMIVFDADMLAHAGLWGVFGMTAWVMIFLNLKSGIAKELNYPVLYLAPPSAFRKLIAVLLPQTIKAAVDGLVFGALIFILLHRTPAESLAAWLTYASISILYTAGMVLVERILGSNRNTMLIMFVYIMLLLLLVVPGIVVASIVFGTGSLGYLLFAAWNVAISLLLVLCCRNVLHSMDIA